MRTAPALLLALVAAACASPPPGVDEVVGVPTEVEVLDAAFVRFEGNRIPMDDFLFEMRERVRGASGDPAAMPAVLVVVEAARELSPSVLDRLTLQLGAAGVRHVTLGSR